MQNNNINDTRGIRGYVTRTKGCLKKLNPSTGNCSGGNFSRVLAGHSRLKLQHLEASTAKRATAQGCFVCTVLK
eukprot:scaffold1216_cov357-Prasinococcus_capsulatus_cf.AAC.5